MHRDFWRVRPRRPRTPASKDSTVLGLLHVPTSPGEYVIQNFLTDVHDGMVPGAKMTMNNAALAELELRVSRALQDAFEDRAYLEPDDTGACESVDGTPF